MESILGMFWMGPRSVLSYTKAPGEPHPRYYLYDLDAHTHTYRYTATLGRYQNDSLGRPWLLTGAGGGEKWIAASVPNAGAFDQTLAFGPGTPIRIEIDILGRRNSQQTAVKLAEAIQARGFKLGPGGWVLRADSTTSTTRTKLSNLRGQRGVEVPTLNITWRLLDPEGNEAWKGHSGGTFDPFTSKYVVIGSRKMQMAGMGGGSTQVRLDYDGKNETTAQLEEVLEKNWYPTSMPTCLVKNEAGYVALPLEVSPDGKQTP